MAFKEYGIGIVSEDKKPESNIIEVVPTEDISDLSGNIAGKSDGGGVNTISAVWIGDDARYSAPDMVVGEKVRLFNFADTDRYFWQSIGANASLRKLEDVTYVFSNTKENDEETTPEKSVIVNISTVGQKVQVTTPTNRGEKVSYGVTIDYGNSTFSIIDSNENHIVLDSVSRHLNVKTSTITLDCDQLTVTGHSKLLKTLTVSDATSLLSTLAVTKATTLKDGLTVIGKSTLASFTAAGSGVINGLRVTGGVVASYFNKG